MRLNRFIAVLAALLLVGIPAFAQTTASLTGNVTLGGSPLPGVTVTITAPTLQGSRTTVTDTNGNYNFVSIPPGDYNVRFEMESMTTVNKPVRVSLSGTARADAELKLTTVAEAITVTATAPAVLETTEIQTNLRQETVERLPLSRTLLATVNLAPGTTQNGPGNATMISGAPSYDNTFYMDGSVINEVLRGQPNNLFIEDAIQETTVQTGAISAEFGRFTGGVVTAVSKAGGNEFSGSIRDFVRNPTWTAASPAEDQRPASKVLHQYEGTLGGRIIRDRLWFFTAGRYFKRDTANFFYNSAPQIPYTFSDKERRLQGKLTAQVTPKHALVGSYFDIKRDQINNCPFVCYEASALELPRSLPNNFRTLDYNGVITNNFLVEGSWSSQQFKFIGGGSLNTGNPRTSTNIETPNINFLGYATFCNNCSSPVQRNNEYWKAKATYFLSSKGLGTQNISGGYEEYADKVKENNYQSGSSFTIYEFHEPTVVNNVVHPDIRAGQALIVWWPVLQQSQGSKFTTQSLFLNDKWDLNQNLSFNVGARYDKNTGKNQQHAEVANDSLVSPRLGLTYDVFGNGRLRANASFSRYSSKTAQGNVADYTSAAGSPSLGLWIYAGPSTVGQTSQQALNTIFNWFEAVGGIKNRDFFVGGQTPGITAIIPTPLKTPAVDEWTAGLGGNITNSLWLRGDVQYRKWRNFYATETNQQTGTVIDPLSEAPSDLSYLINSNDFTRNYRAVLLQAGWRPFSRVNLGANYTWSKLRGNIVGESSGSGPVPSATASSYPEISGFAQNNPTGYLGADQRHKVRAWASYDLPLARIGTFNFSVLQRYDSGLPYSLATPITTDAYISLNEATGTYIVNNKQTSYVTPPSTVNYYFSGRGQFRFDNISSTDVSVNYFLPIGRAQFFIESQMLNAFNRQGRVNFNTDPEVLHAFNPLTTTPVRCPAGMTREQCTNTKLSNGEFAYQWWTDPETFGKAKNATTLFQQGDYQLPRTYRFSVGLRF